MSGRAPNPKGLSFKPAGRGICTNCVTDADSLLELIDAPGIRIVIGPRLCFACWHHLIQKETAVIPEHPLVGSGDKKAGH